MMLLKKKKNFVIYWLFIFFTMGTIFKLHKKVVGSNLSLRRV